MIYYLPIQLRSGRFFPTTRQLVDHIGFQIIKERRLKGGKFPVREHNLCIGDAANLVCKELTLISSILKHEHWGVTRLACHQLFRFLSSLVLIYLQEFCLVFLIQV